MAGWLAGCPFADRVSVAASDRHCTADCPLWESKKARAFACGTHGAVHECGWDCNRREPSQDGEVCRLTGHIVRPPALMHHFARNSETRRAVQTHMGAPATRASRQQQQANTSRRHALAAVKLLLAGEQRCQITLKRRRRVTVEATRALKRSAGFAEVYAATAVAAIRAGEALREALPAGHPAMETVAGQIAEFALTLKVATTRQSIFAFAAACIQQLSTGSIVGGTTLFPRLELLAATAPAELDHGVLLGLSCRAVSQASRKIVTAAITNDGYVRPGFAFPLTAYAAARISASNEAETTASSAKIATHAAAVLVNTGAVGTSSSCSNTASPTTPQ